MPQLEPIRQKVPKKIWESPDGEHCFEKALETTFFTTKWGTFWAAYEMIAFSRPTTFGAISSRLIYWTVPAAAIGFTYASTSGLLGKIRGKDDFVNHALAAAASSSYIGMRYGAGRGLAAAAISAVIMGFVKEVKNSGLNVFPQDRIHKDHSFFFDHHNRFYGPKILRHDVEEPKNY